MNEVKITYETLFDLLRREKAREELQKLDDTFYSDVIQYLKQKQTMLNSDATQSGLFGASESEKIKIQIQNIKKIIKELYERRESKILKTAINKSKTGSDISNTTSMLPEEKNFFNESLLLLNKHRKEILSQILLFEQNTKKTQEPTLEQEKAVIKETKEEAEETQKAETTEQNTEEQEEQKETPQKEETDEYEIKIKVKFKAKMPKFVGKKLEIYGPYEEEDTAELPKIIANILINKQKAEKI